MLLKNKPWKKTMVNSVIGGGVMTPLDKIPSVPSARHQIKHQEVLGSILTGSNIFLLNLFYSYWCRPLLVTLPTCYNLGKTGIL